MNYPLINNKENEIRRIYFPELDGLRFFAFLLVFIHHQNSFITTPFLSIIHTHGWIGVDLFFALSTFLLTKLLLTEYGKSGTISVKKFYIRRILRIWPAYFMFIGFSIIIHVLFIGTISNEIGIRIFGLLAFSDNIFSAFNGYNLLPFAAHLWTISYEEQFYIFIPIVTLLLVQSSQKIKIVSLATVFILCNAIRLILIFYNVHHPAIWVLPFAHFESSILGIVIGFGGFNFLLKKLNALTIGLIGMLFVLMLSFLPALEITSYWLIISYFLAGISVSMILFSVSNSIHLRSAFSNKTIVFLGKRSYGLYIYHLLGIGIASYITNKFPEIPSNRFNSFIYSFCFTVFAAIISYHFIETPFLKLKSRFETVISRPI